jgi:hypothetical protein
MEIELNGQDTKINTLIEKPKKVKKVKKPKKEGVEGNYINNAVLLPEVIKCKAEGKVSNRLAEMFYQLATRYLSAKNFAHLPYKDDLIQNAVMTLCANGLKFKDVNAEGLPNENPFAYFTTCIYHASLQYIASEKKQKDIRDQMLVDEGVSGSLGYMESAKDDYREEHKDFFLAE